VKSKLSNTRWDSSNPAQKIVLAPRRGM